MMVLGMLLGFLGVVPVLLLMGECAVTVGLVCWGVGVVFGNRIVDVSIFACLRVR